MDLRAVVHMVVSVNVMHQKIAVIDERTVMIGSLNTLSQAWTREVMVTMRGDHFARKPLEHEHAELFTRPPKCARCGGTSIKLRRRSGAATTRSAKRGRTARATPGTRTSGWRG
ncbi:phospholipase D-like domain-containing protein [Streptomyces sp. NPDC050546]|uniref:phospholipase D-like domain-containing protein n=1 Tax=Streptomyces sp. NPDC050546 TaxID=3365628 RepID=UPI00379779DA